MGTWRLFALVCMLAVPGCAFPTGNPPFAEFPPDVLYLGREGGAALLLVGPDPPTHIPWMLRGNVTPASGSVFGMFYENVEGEISRESFGFDGLPVSVSRSGVVRVGSQDGVRTPPAVSESPTPFEALDSVETHGIGGRLWIIWGDLGDGAVLEIGASEDVQQASASLSFAGEPGDDTSVYVAGVQRTRSTQSWACPGASLVVLAIYADDAPIDGAVRVSLGVEHEIEITSMPGSGFRHHLYAGTTTGGTALAVDLTGGRQNTRLLAHVACASGQEASESWADWELPSGRS